MSIKQCALVGSHTASLWPHSAGWSSHSPLRCEGRELGELGSTLDRGVLGEHVGQNIAGTF